jgi:ribosomal protein S12 methylthiotransferase accessory factor
MEIYFAGNKQVYADFNGFTVKTDQAVRSGGDGAFPEPFALFLASLGTCAGIYVKSFCDQRGIPTDQIRLTQEPRFDPVRHIIGVIDLEIHVPADFPEKYEQALIQTASLCAVKRHLKEDIKFNVKVVRLGS